jgi:hypothetical protein
MIRPLRAFPPNAPARKRCHVPRRQWSIPVRMPQRRRFGKTVTERMPIENHVAGAERAASAVRGAALDAGMPDMARVLAAAPPDAPAGARPDVPRSDGAVSLTVPFAGDGRLQERQGIAPAHRAPAAKRATAAGESANLHRRPPSVVRRLGTPPPDPASRSSRDVRGGELAVPLSVPLPGSRRHCGCQGSCPGRAIVLAERTAIRAPPIGTCLPLVSGGDPAPPPDRTPRVERHVGRAERGVSLPVEFGCKARETGEGRHDLAGSADPEFLLVEFDFAVDHVADGNAQTAGFLSTVPDEKED